MLFREQITNAFVPQQQPCIIRTQFCVFLTTLTITFEDNFTLPSLDPFKCGNGQKLRNLRGLCKPKAQKKESDEELSGAQFLCEKILRYLTLEEALDHRRPRRMQC